MSPKVSIIVPVYNVETYLETCVVSLLRQSLRDIEIILIDDGSQDRSSEMVDEYATKDSRIVVIHQKNGGVSVARNTGLDCATAPYVMFCDPDDFYSLNMCEVMYEAIERSQADMAVCGTNIIYETNGFSKQGDEIWFSIKSEGLMERHLLNAGQTNHCVWNKIIRRSLIEEHHLRFPPGLKYEDIYFGHAIFLYSKQIFFIKEKLINYRRRSGSIMEQTVKKISVSSIDHMTNFFLLWDRFKEDELLEVNKNYLCNLFFICFRDALRNEWNEERKALILRQVCNFTQREWIIDPEFSLARRRDILFLKNGSDPRTIKGIAEPKKITNTFIQDDFGELYTRYYYRGVLIAEKRIKGKKYDYTERLRVLGIQVSKNKVRLIDKLPKISPVKNNSSSVLKVLRRLGEFTYIPSPGNFEDIFQSGASLNFFERNGLPYKLLADTSQRDVLVCSGRLWSMGNCDLWLKFLPWFDRANQVVILPSSFYNIPQLLEKFDERFIIFCRDKKSYHYLKKTKTKATVILGHDLTLQMNLGCYSTELLLRYQEEAYRKEYKDTLSHLLWNLPRNEYRGVFLRQDGESVAHSWNSLQNDMDLPEFVYTDENVTRKFILYYTLLFLSCLDQQQEIVTDRLHVAIACVLMGKNVLMADNASGENFAVYEQSLKHVSNIRKLHPHDVIEKCEESIKRRYKIESVILTA